MKYIISCLSLILLTSICFALDIGNTNLCPVERFIEPLSPTAFSQRFNGDTIFFSVPDVDNSFFETFKLLNPDTLWLKERPKNKLPQEHKHFILITHFSPVSGWGVNAYRQYTPGTALEKNKFIFRGSLSETIQYLGTFNYILLEDVATRKLIKWDYTKNENKDLIIFSPSILQRLSHMKGNDFNFKKNDSTIVSVKCIDVAFSISVKPKNWIINLDVDFFGETGHYSSHNWNPIYFIKK